MRAQAQFGDALRVPVESLSQRLRRDGRADEAPSCSGRAGADGGGPRVAGRSGPARERAHAERLQALV
jgi:hypothetical protein